MDKTILLKNRHELYMISIEMIRFMVKHDKNEVKNIVEYIFEDDIFRCLDLADIEFGHPGYIETYVTGCMRNILMEGDYDLVKKIYTDQWDDPPQFIFDQMIAVKSPELLTKIIDAYPDRILLGYKQIDPYELVKFCQVTDRASFSFAHYLMNKSGFEGYSTFSDLLENYLETVKEKYQ
jgi:hypothetical protein